jgi:very-short-patch-repair endonuclease
LEERPRNLFTRSDHFGAARRMRKQLTPQEAQLWRVLKGLRSEGYHFRRQAPFRGYYLDFVCFKHRLVVEVDGGQHAFPEQARHDAVRDAVLAREGFRTLRFWNGDINTNLEGVCESIWGALSREPPPWRASRACPSPQGGGRIA